MGFGLLVVDDEALIRQGIIARLKHLGYEFDVILEADDGTTALETYEKGQINIIFTDIKMTEVNGLQLIHKIKEQDEDVQFVIVSGYDDFAYAEEAIRLGVTAYLLKPISNEKLQDVMGQVIDNLEKLRLARQGALKVARSEVESQERDYERALNELVNADTFEEAKDLMSLHPALEAMTEPQLYYCISVISVDMNRYREKNMEYQDIELVRFTIKNIFDELSEESNCCIADNLLDKKQMYVISYGKSPEEIRRSTQEIFEVLQANLWKFARMEVSIGVSRISEELDANRLQEAREALLQRIIHGNGNLFYYDDIKVLAAGEFPTAELALLKRYVEARDIGNVEFILNDLLSEERVSQHNMNYVGVLWMQVLNMLFHSMDLSINTNAQQLEHEVYGFPRIIRTEKLEDIRASFMELIENTMQGEAAPDADAESKIRMAEKYIETHYSEDLSVSDLAERFFMSPNYFSTMFKKRTGVPAVAYLKKVRMDRAKKELEESDRSVAEIAELVGYNDSQYFFKLFKRETGVTPQQYRRLKQ
ncbi:MAG: response regulator [Lachnospiraceae bacterium]|nr:response regulator [Lachnospiraceae bacterium]